MFQWQGGWFGLEGVSGGVVPGDLVIGVPRDGPSVFVDQPVMEGTQSYQVVEVGGSAVGPVHDVVDLGPAGAPAAGEPAVLVAGLDESFEPGGDGAGGSPYSDYPVTGVGDG